MVDSPRNEILHGDLFDVLPDLPDGAVDAVVTDPPYNFDGLFGEEWDEFDDSHAYQEWCCKWAEECYRLLPPGGHLLAFGSNRQHHRLFAGLEDAGFEIRDTITWVYGNGMVTSRDVGKQLANDECVDSETAERFAGTGTRLKPAAEFVAIARKPLAEDTVAENVAEYGTGALNVDAVRIPVVGRDRGRHPPNVAFDEAASDALDEQSGERGHGHWTGEDTDGYGEDREYTGPGDYGESGGASRFFYTSKASESERTLDGRIENDHISVKPVDMMEYLVKLAAVEGQLVLDPFAGTGSTLVASKNVHRDFLGVEREDEWVNVAKARVGLQPDDPDSLVEDDQTTLGGYDDE